MNSKWAWVAGAVVVIAIGAFLFMRDGQGTKSEEANNSVSSEQQGTLKSLLASKSAMKCTFADTEASSKSEGTVYVSNGKMRGDFTSVANGQTFAGHMIMMDNTMNTWMDGSNSGFKIAFDASAQTSGQTSSRGLDANKNMDYNCSPWLADNSVFTLPTGVTFSDMGSITAPTGGANADKCGACDNAGAYRAQCRAALGCK